MEIETLSKGSLQALTLRLFDKLEFEGSLENRINYIKSNISTEIRTYLKNAKGLTGKAEIYRIITGTHEFLKPETMRLFENLNYGMLKNNHDNDQKERFHRFYKREIEPIQNSQHFPEDKTMCIFDNIEKLEIIEKAKRPSTNKKKISFHDEDDVPLLKRMKILVRSKEFSVHGAAKEVARNVGPVVEKKRLGRSYDADVDRIYKAFKQKMALREI
jgi:hypothetical protein